MRKCSLSQPGARRSGAQGHGLGASGQEKAWKTLETGVGNRIGSASHFREQVCCCPRLLSSELGRTELPRVGLTEYKYHNVSLMDTETLPHLLGAQPTQGRGGAE